jgi:hypothetical protein
MDQSRRAVEVHTHERHGLGQCAHIAATSIQPPERQAR